MFNYTVSQIIQGGNITNESDFNFESKVYFLIKNKIVVYVGQTKRFASRISQHSDKDFDNVSFICVPENYLSDVEAHYIVKLNPELNKGLPGSSLFVTKGNIKTIIRSMVNDMSNDIDVAYKSKGKSFNNQEFCRVEDAIDFIKSISLKLNLSPDDYIIKIRKDQDNTKDSNGSEQ